MSDVDRVVVDRHVVRGALYCVTAVVTERRRIGAPIPQWLRDAQVALETAVSPDGPQPGTPVAPLDGGCISSSDAAALLNCSVRHARRLAGDLDGRRIGRTWTFNANLVREYAQAKKETDRG